MAIPIKPHQARQLSSDPIDRERFLHFIARESIVPLRIGVLLLLALTVVTMVTMWFWAIIPAIALLGVYMMLVVADLVEHGTARADSPENSSIEATASGEAIVHDEAAAVDPVERQLLKRESFNVAWIFLAVAIAAGVIAAFFLPWKLFLIGAGLLFFYMLFVMGPVWLASIEDDIEDETERLNKGAHATMEV